MDTVYTNTLKAGMEQVDQEVLKDVVYSLSKDSEYYANESRKNAATEKRIESLRRKLAGLHPNEVATSQRLALKDVLEKKSGRDLTRMWLHVDMDSFYASVEELLDPSLKGAAFAVGSMSMISTSSYAARAYGVRSAMPGFIGRSLCPELKFVTPKFEEYRKYSEITRRVYAAYDPQFESVSLDEAYLDITEYLQESFSGCMKGAIECAYDVQKRVYEETGGLTCSIGIGPNTLLAKLNSDRNKPNGVAYISVPPLVEDIEGFMKDLEVRKIPGIGRVSAKVLQDVLGIETCGDILAKAGLIRLLFSESSYQFYVTSALGLGPTRHKGSDGRKSISTERTFTPTSDWNILDQYLLSICDRVSEDMRRENLSGKHVTLKIKLSNFVVKTRSCMLEKFVKEKGDLYEHGRALLQSEMPVEIRLMGIRVSHFLEEQRQDPGQQTLPEMLSLVGQKQQQQESLVSQGKDDAWVCSVCTYENHCNAGRWCDMCMSSRKTGYRPQGGDGMNKKKRMKLKDFITK